MKNDKINNLKSKNAQKMQKNVQNSSKTRVIGVKIDTKSTKTKDKVYYYKTDKKFEVGDRIRVQVPSGGTPLSTVSEVNSKKKVKRIKKLLEESK